MLADLAESGGLQSCFVRFAATNMSGIPAVLFGRQLFIEWFVLPPPVVNTTLHLLRTIPGRRLRSIRRTPCDMGLPCRGGEAKGLTARRRHALRDGRLRSDGRCRTSWPRRPPHHAVSLRTVAIRVLASAAGPSGFIDRRTSWICLATRIYSSTSEGDTTLCLITSNRRHR